MMGLREARRRRLMSIRALAEKAGVSPTTVQYAESGRRSPGFRSIRDLSAALEMDPLEIAEFRAVIEGTGAGRRGAAASERTPVEDPLRRPHPAADDA
jgi:transcriptional regulator with XRE-family HTH domain